MLGLPERETWTSLEQRDGAKDATIVLQMTDEGLGLERAVEWAIRNVRFDDLGRLAIPRFLEAKGSPAQPIVSEVWA